MRKIGIEGGRRVALASLAAVAGTGFASGRELTAFFAQLGRCAWLSAVVASAFFGLATGLLCQWARRCRAASPDEAARELGPAARRAVLALHRLLLALAAAAMLAGAARMGALALPMRLGWLWGILAALLAALLVNLGKLRALPWLGALAFAAGVIWYTALALDPSPTRIFLPGETVLALEDSVPAAVALGLLYGAMNACVAAPAALRFSRGASRPLRAGALSGGMLFAVLAAALAALKRGGRTLLAQAMPEVLLAARWGLAGFWLCAGFAFFCACCTLSAALAGLLPSSRPRGMLNVINRP
ncbi:MAG: hypothetical protein Q4C10_14610 [Clostridia bacterium]|nr:hypothetical protein [Clostridia bacterium]